VVIINLTERQKKIIDVVKDNGPLTGKEIAEFLDVKRATLRSDFVVLTMSGLLNSKPKVGYSYSKQSETARTKFDDLKNYRVAEMMDVPNVLPENTTLYDAIITIFLKNTESIFVTQGGYLSGIISRKDLLKHAIGGNDLRNMPIAVIMTRVPNVVICKKEDDAMLAAKKLVEHDIDSIPVVEKLKIGTKNRYKIIGKFSKSTFTNFLVENYGFNRGDDFEGA
jgi:CBS domain-containing protein